jgi:Raf kinase inhibitor-like YbhB/YbcL family protein
MTFQLTSPAFSDGGNIPDKYSRDGSNISPPLVWSDVPDGTKSLALIMDDPDAPSGLFVHWILYGIPTNINKIAEGEHVPSTIPGSRHGHNGFGTLGYDGPQPPKGTHRYYFHLFALNKDPALKSGATQSELNVAMQGHILAEAQLMGRFRKRQSGSTAA